jgi:hypothetical protein
MVKSYELALDAIALPPEDLPVDLCPYFCYTMPWFLKFPDEGG